MEATETLTVIACSKAYDWDDEEDYLEKKGMRGSSILGDQCYDYQEWIKRKGRQGATACA